jgi:N-acyl homoserine lactone hydrolase
MSDYSIWVLEYSFVSEYPVSGVLYGAHNAGTLKLPYCYVLLKSDERTVMVDVGYNVTENGNVLADRYNVINWRSPATVLAEVGVRPEDVTDVLVTHAHFDHFGNVDAFPNATFYLQAREFAEWLRVMTLPKAFQSLAVALDPGDMVRAAGLAAEGRLTLLEGDTPEVLPGIDAVSAFDSHTFGSQFFHVKNDLRYVFENITGTNDNGVYRPVGLASGSQYNLLLATENMMNAVDRDHLRVVPVHEARLGTVYPSRVSSEGLEIVEVNLAPGHPSRVS